MFFKPGKVIRGFLIAIVIFFMMYLLCVQTNVRRPLPPHKVFFQLDESTPNISQLRRVDIQKSMVTAGFTSPILTTKDTVKEVKRLYSTSRKLRHFFEKPELRWDKFTVVMPSYNRTSTLNIIFNHYCKMADVIDKLLVVWNNVGVPVPEELQRFQCHFPIVFLTQTKNRLNNRFIPFPEIETECVFSLDDDRLVPKNAIHFGFNVWKSFPHLLVGFVPRTHVWVDGKYFYRTKVNHGDIYSMILTVSAFLNRKYLELYTNVAPNRIREFVDNYQNGEDISMMAVISNYLKQIDKTQCACLWVRERMKEIEKQREKGLFKKLHHFEERNQCLNVLDEVYGTLPIQYCSLEVTRVK